MHNSDSNSAQSEWHVDLPTPDCKLRLKNESPFARRPISMTIRFTNGTGDRSCASCFSSLGLKRLHNVVNVSFLIRKLFP